MAYDITLKYTAEFLRGIPDKNLEEMIGQAQQAHYELRTQASPSGRVKVPQKPDLFGKVKGDIARMKTILKER